jgi:hypothetical protein
MIGFKQTATVALLATGLVFGSTAQAALIDRGSGLIYDTDLNITWLQNANLGAGSIYDNGYSNFDGKMSWQSAMAWADNLVYGGYSDWRLPSTSICFGDCYSGELGHLFFAEAGIGGVAGGNLNNFFTHIQYDNYWTNLQRPDPFTDFAFAIDTHNIQLDWAKGYNNYAWAVRNGDVTAVPLPSALWLFASGLGLLSFTRRKKQSS